MRTFNPVAAVVDGLKHQLETQTLPEALEGTEPVVLAEARFRLAEIAQVATELRKLVDQELAAHLAGGAMRYGGQILRPATSGAAKIVDEGAWWPKVVEALKATDRPETVLAILYRASDVRLGGLPVVAAAIGEDPDVFRKEHVRYDPPTTALQIQPVERAPKWTHSLAEGQLSNRRVEQ